MTRGILTRTAFGRALASVRAMRGATLEGLAADWCASPTTLTWLETGRRHVDGVSVRTLARILGASIEDRRRLADGMCQSRLDGCDVRLDLAPECQAGTHAAASLAVFSDDLTAGAWEQIERVIYSDIEAQAVTRKAAA